MWIESEFWQSSNSRWPTLLHWRFSNGNSEFSICGYLIARHIEFYFIWLVLKLWVFMFHVNILTIEYQTVVFFLCWIAILYSLYIILLGTITSFLWGEFGLLCWVSIFVFLTSCSFHFIFSGNIPQTPTAWLKTQVFKALRFQRGLPNFKNFVFTKVELIYYMPYTYTYGTRLFDILRPW